MYAGADRMFASLLDPKTVGIVYSFGAFHKRKCLVLLVIAVSAISLALNQDLFLSTYSNEIL